MQLQVMSAAVSALSASVGAMAARVFGGRRRAPVASAQQFVMQLSNGVCRDAVHANLAAARAANEDCDAALDRCFAWCVDEFPEEIVLWGLNGGFGAVPWSNANFQRCVRAAVLALRDVRGQISDLGAQREAMLAQVVDVATAPVAFTGTWHRLDSLVDMD